MKQNLKSLFLLAGLFATMPFGAKAETPIQMTVQSSRPNAHKFSFTSIDGDEINLSDYAGKVVLVVNTASKCGYTGQYKDLQTLHDQYSEQGLVVLGVPSADFVGQEFATESEVKEFTEENYKITFPLTVISHVIGSNAHPFYKWAGQEAGFLGGPKWNFHKYLIDVNGNFLKSYSTMTTPVSSEITRDIEAALKDVVSKPD